MARLQSGTRIYGNATIDTVLSIDGSNTANSNITGALRVAGGIGVKGNVFSSGVITGIDANLGNLVTANYFSGTLTTASQPNITSVGTLGNLTVTNSANVGTLNAVDSIITGNLTVGGTTTYVNVTSLSISDPIIEQGGGANNAALTTDDNKDRGQLLHYYDGGAIDAFMGWDNSNSEFAFGSNVTVSSDVVTFNTLGNVRVNTVIGNVSGTASTVTTNAQPNITSVGTLTSLDVTGNLTSGNANLGNLAKANYFEGNGHLLTGVKAYLIENGTSNVKIATANSNVTISVDGTNNIFNIGTANTTIKGDFIPNADNTYSLGSSTNKWKDLHISGNTIYLGESTIRTVGNTISLPSIAVAGVSDLLDANITVKNVANFKILGGQEGYVLRTDGNGNLAWSSAGSLVGGQTEPGGLNGQIQFNDNGSFSGNTGLVFNKLTGTLSTTNLVVSNPQSGTGNIKSDNANLGNLVTANYFSGNGSLLTGIANSDAALTVTSSSQPNITSVGTLTSLDVSGNVSFTGNVSLGNVNKLRIQGGAANYILKTDGNGNLSWGTVEAGASSSIIVDTFVANGVQNTFTLSTTPSNANVTTVNYNGVTLLRESYSISGANLVFNNAPAANSKLEVTTISSLAAGGSVGFIWNIANSNITMSSNNGYFVDTTNGAKTMTLPTNASLGDTIRINDLAGTFASNACTIARNGHKIQGVADDLVSNTNQSSFGLVYSNSTYGWKILEVV
jgi:hypothetical protein